MSTIGCRADSLADISNSLSDAEVYGIGSIIHPRLAGRTDTESPRPSAAVGSRRGAQEAARVRRANFEMILTALERSTLDTGEVARLLGVTAAAARKYVFTLREVGVIELADNTDSSGAKQKHCYQLALPIGLARESLLQIGTVAEHRRRREGPLTSDQNGFERAAAGQRLHLAGSSVARRTSQGRRDVGRDPLVAALFGPGAARPVAAA
ncbi:hypothetical protein [Duganella vulcania]|uniref:Helix-turn-helix domain-containing protein n=1 Tax=Duganella vulcania TaxID=2692166 RepID=A0A845GJ97_9BURK|nr:hypothetical protein [Duganella vulcania]MYM92807.1 hypothetical protein [Duganella vulcania]